MATDTKKTEKSWQEMTPDEKLQKRIDAWLAAPGIEFASSQARTEYKARINRFLDAATLRKVPDRVPVLAELGNFIGRYYGYTSYDMMYNAEKVVEVAMKATQEFQLDTQIGAAGARPGKVMDILDEKQYLWPGHGIPVNSDMQFKEEEWMKADEYDALVEDPSDYRLRVFLPRAMGALQPLSKLPPLSGLGSAAAGLSAFGLPEVEAALNKLVEAGKAALEWQRKVGPIRRRLTELGFPVLDGGNSGVPFARINDSLRGTRGIMADIFRQPGKVMEALEWMTPRLLKDCLDSARLGDSPLVHVHMHKGGDGIMSPEHYKAFYWGPLRKLCLGLIEEGLIPRLSMEGPFNSRWKLEMFRELPKGRAVWWSEGRQTDMAQLKEVFGNVACIEGDVPAALLKVGTPQEVTDYCRRLIDVAGKSGGYIFDTSFIDGNSRAENVWAMIKCAKEYGVYA